MLIVEKHDRAARLDVKGTGSMLDGVLDDLHDAFYGDRGFGFDLQDGAAHDGCIEEGLSGHYGFGYELLRKGG